MYNLFRMTNCNYYEYYLFTNLVDVNDTVIDIGKEKFIDFLKKISNNNLKYFQKEYKEYHYGDIVYQNYNNEEIKVTKTTPIETVTAKGCLRIGCIRQKLNIINVPSNANADVIYYVKHLIFRFTSRIYLNMIVKKDTEGHESFSVYINYNHDSNVDIPRVNESLNKIIKMVTGAPISEICH